MVDAQASQFAGHLRAADGPARRDAVAHRYLHGTAQDLWLVGYVTVSSQPESPHNPTPGTPV